MPKKPVLPNALDETEDSSGDSGIGGIGRAEASQIRNRLYSLLRNGEAAYGDINISTDLSNFVDQLYAEYNATSNAQSSLREHPLFREANRSSLDGRDNSKERGDSSSNKRARQKFDEAREARRLELALGQKMTHGKRPRPRPF